MNEHVAGPGELTCIEDTCPVSGLGQPDGRSACPECGTELARMPSAVPEQAPVPGTYAAPNRVSDSRTAWQRRSPLFRIGVAVAAVALIWLVSFIARNPDALHRVTGAGYAVGDCVHVEQGFRDASMKKADCGAAGDSLLSGDPVYRVAAVEKGKDASCPGGGFDHVTFSNEPENMTYCLVIE
jgi:hypothetical protein